MQKTAIFEHFWLFFNRNCVSIIPQSIGKISLREIFPMSYVAGGFILKF